MKIDMTNKKDNYYTIHTLIDTAWKECQSEWALRSVDHYHRALQSKCIPVHA